MIREAGNARWAKKARACYCVSGLLLPCLFLSAKGIGSVPFFNAALCVLSLAQLAPLCVNDRFLRKNEIRQLLPIYLFFAVFVDAACLGGDFTGSPDGMGAVLPVLFALFNGGTLLLLATLVRAKKPVVSGSWRAALKERWPLWVILGLFLISSLDIFFISLRVDAWIYYSKLAKAVSWNFNFLDLEPLRLAGHYAYGFVLWALIGEYLLPYNAYGVLAVQIVMGTITVLCVYNILRKLCGNRWLVAAGTAIFAFSPAFGGILGEFGTDFGLTCFFIWMFCCHMYDLRLLEVAVGAFFCFTKETALVTYAAYVLGLLLVDVIKLRKENGGKFSLRRIFSDGMTPRMCIPGLLWGVHFLCGGMALWGKDNWWSLATSGEELPEHCINVFRWDGLYVKYQMDTLFVLHFSWVIVLCVLVGAAVILLKRRKMTVGHSAIILLTSYIGFIIIELLFITYINYRYVQLNIFFLVVALVCVLDRLAWKKVAYSVAGLVLVLLVVENYYVADPATRALYQAVEIGDTQMVSTTKFHAYFDRNREMILDQERISKLLMRNGASNNRQYVYFGKLMNMAFADIDYDAETAILAPRAFDSFTSGNIFGRKSFEDVDLICYDTKNRILLLNNAYPERLEEPDMVPLHLYWQKDVTATPDTGGTGYQDLYYFAFPFCQEENRAFLQTHEVLETREFAYRGWRMQVYKVAR